MLAAWAATGAYAYAVAYVTVIRPLRKAAKRRRALVYEIRGNKIYRA